MNCKKCGSPNVIKYGKRRLKKGWVQKYRCKNCGSIFYIKIEGDEGR